MPSMLNATRRLETESIATVDGEYVIADGGSVVMSCPNYEDYVLTDGTLNLNESATINCAGGELNGSVSGWECQTFLAEPGYFTMCFFWNTKS